MYIITLDINFQLWAALPPHKLTLLCFTRKPMASETKQRMEAQQYICADDRKQKYTTV
jgi:hypothetical protein